MVGVRHYANFDEDEVEGVAQRAVVEEVCTAKNIYLCGQEDEESILENENESEVNIGIQTDPLREEDFESNIGTLGSFEEEEDRIQRLR